MEGTKDFWVLCISLGLSLITFVVILIRMGTQVGASCLRLTVAHGCDWRVLLPTGPSRGL
jgi:hypothetical protein